MARLLAFCLLLASASGIAACKKEDPPPTYPPSAQQPGPAPYSAPTAPYSAPTAPYSVPTAVVPATAPAPVTGAAALGMPCVSDLDLQCPFAHCVANRCGGCTNASACKPGSQCFPTLLGYACFPGTATPAPAATNVPGGPLPPAPAAPGNPSDPLDARARCVQRTNEFRARVAVSALARRSDREACGDTQAQNDGQTGTAHGAFGRCQEGAQNECPGWPGPVDQVVDQCLAQMFAEGPGSFAGHGHYLNMTDPTYRGVACGITTLPNGQVWLVQDFYR